VRKLLLLALLLAACPTSTSTPTSASAPVPSGPPPADGPLVVFTGSRGDAWLSLAVAQTPSEKEKGLAGLESMAPTFGMLFVFDDDQDRTFWTKGTKFRVDIIFIDSRKDVVGVARNIPADNEVTRSVGRLSRYVVETNAGWADAHGVDTGAKARFERIPGLE
jgi:uncharacterized membrane protein (UPF0127 family)